MKLHKFWAAVGTALAIFAFAAAVVVVPPAQAQTYSVLYTFNGKHGKNPVARLIQDKNGTLYGTTAGGGAYGDGVVFKLTPNGKEKVLYSFTGGTDGANPAAGLVRDSVGNLYGTTAGGGAYGDGVVFKLKTTGAETVLHAFTGKDGANPSADLVRDKAGNLYGTTGNGGTYDYGVVFKLDTTGAETVLYEFTGGADGAAPVAGLVRDKAGNLYGTTPKGGDCIDWGIIDDCGLVFKLDKSGAYTVLHSFNEEDAGLPVHPMGSLVRDSFGNLYGMADSDDPSFCCPGVVFELDETGAYTLLHAFTGDDGNYPMGSLVRDSSGNLYGTTPSGGLYGAGVVFKLTPNGKEKVLYSFTGGTDGANPSADLVRDKAGNLYGTTPTGGRFGGVCGARKGCGVVFKITPQ